jgi:hypothetical protein
VLGLPRRPLLVPGLTAAAVVASLVLVPVATTPIAAAAPAPARPAAGELPERRTASSATRRNADGSLTTTLYAAPVHYRTAAGGWERIDRRLVDAGPAAGPDVDGYRWRTAAHAFDARFADRAGADFLQLTVDGARFRLSAEGAAGDPARADGPVVRYAAAFGGTELSYAVLATGVKSLLTLTGPDDPASYTFRLAGPPTGPPPTVRRRPDGAPPPPPRSPTRNPPPNPNPNRTSCNGPGTTPRTSSAAPKTARSTPARASTNSATTPSTAPTRSPTSRPRPRPRPAPRPAVN